MPPGLCPGTAAGALGAAHLPCPGSTVLGCPLPPPGPGTGALQVPGSSGLSNGRRSDPTLPGGGPGTLGIGNPPGGATLPTRGAFALPQHRDLARPCKADFLGQMWRLAATRTARAPWQSPPAPAPASEEGWQAGAVRVPHPPQAMLPPARVLTEAPCTPQGRSEE